MGRTTPPQAVPSPPLASPPLASAGAHGAARRSIALRRGELVAAALAAAGLAGCPAPRPCLSVAVAPVVPRDPHLKNPVDAEGHPILRDHDGAGCHVELPFSEPPTSVVPLPTEPVDCPSALLADPAWEACRGGKIYQRDLTQPDVCVCFEHGDPPAERPIACPKP